MVLKLISTSLNLLKNSRNPVVPAGRAGVPGLIHPGNDSSGFIMREKERERERERERVIGEMKRRRERMARKQS